MATLFYLVGHGLCFFKWLQIYRVPVDEQSLDRTWWPSRLVVLCNSILPVHLITNTLHRAPPKTLHVAQRPEPN
jgi:hypothetical protein